MNHIKKLQKQNRIYEDDINELKRYLQSSKFHWPENHVNVNDIFLRLSEMDSKLNDLDFE